MANKGLFASLFGRKAPAATAVNEAGGTAYAFGPKHALAQYAATGCLHSTFYATDVEQLGKVLELARQVDDEMLAKTAIFARSHGRMKDVPALLCAVLSTRNPQLLARVFPRVVDNGRMLRTFVQIVRSGTVGRKSLGTSPKRLVASWLEARSDEQLLRDAVGQAPSLADVVKMVHPRPSTPSRRALYGYLLGRPHDASALPLLAKQLESFKATRQGAVPDVPFQLLTALALGRAEWTAIARQASWTSLRMNLNTYARHGVFDDPAMVAYVASRLRDVREIERARVLPYQLLIAHRSTGLLPDPIRAALGDAMELALRNVPRVEGKVFVLPDVSGSMQSPVTGHRKGATTAVRCVDVAALVAAAFLRKNPLTEVLPFDTTVHEVRLDPRAPVAVNADALSRVGGGGTSVSVALAQLVARRAKGHLVVIVSDNQSWADTRAATQGTETMRQWSAFRVLNPDAKLVCLDLQPYATTQAAEREDVLNVGGFSDDVFGLVGRFATGGLDARHWVAQIEQVAL